MRICHIKTHDLEAVYVVILWTHGVGLRYFLVVGNTGEKDDSDDRIQHKREEEILMESYPLTTQAPARRENNQR